MRQFLRTTMLWFLVAFVGDALVAPMIDIAGRAPDFTIIALVMLALSAGAVPATVGGFAIGLVQDLGNPPLLGLRSLCKCILGFGLGRLRGRLVHGVIVVDAAMIVLAVLLHDFVFLLVQSNLTQERFLVPLLTMSLPTAVYSALVGVPLLRLAEFVGVLRPED
ncbi:MAG: rod shape-determining protein MreD [bacterium]|nr:rod shape-determining protein MreD [bacterium]